MKIVRKCRDDPMFGLQMHIPLLTKEHGIVEDGMA